MAAKIIYFDPSSPDSGQDGSFAHPWTTPALAITAASTAENVIYAKRGTIFFDATTSAAAMYFNAHRPAGYTLVRDYGDAEMAPTVSAGYWMPPGNSGWVYVSDGVWKKPIANSPSSLAQTMRLFRTARLTGSVANRSLGTGYDIGVAMCRTITGDAPTEAEVMASMHTMSTAAYRVWTFTTDSGGYLYVYTGTAAQDPPTYYEGLCLVGYSASGSTNGRLNGIYLLNSANVTVDGIDSLFAWCGVRIKTSTISVGDNTVTNANVLGWSSKGILFDGVSGFQNLRAKAVNMLVDSVATLEEEWNWGSQTTDDVWLEERADAVQIGEYTTSCLMDRVTSYDGYHTNFYIGTTDGSKDGFTIDARVVDCVASQPNRLYGALLSCAGLGTGNIANIVRFKGSNATCFLEHTGSGQQHFSDCSFSQGKAPYSTYTQPGTTQKFVAGILLFSNAPFGALEAGGLTFNRVTFMNPYGWMIQENDNGDGSIPVGAITAADSLFVDQSYLDDPTARMFSSSLLRPGISISGRDATAPAGWLNLGNSYYWTGEAGQPRVADTTSTTATLAAYAGLAGTWSEADPMIDSRGGLLAGSPLKSAASGIGGGYDADSRARSYPTSIGAYEYVEPRASRL